MKVLVLGDGLLGSEIVNQTGWEYISRKKDKFDITNDSTFNKLLKVEHGVIQYCPYDVIVNAIAYTNSYSQDNTLHYAVNYKGVADLVQFCNQWKVKLVHISTEFVYANNTSLPTEEDIPQPDNNWYAYTKLLADEHIKMFSNDYLICRELHKPSPFPYSEVWDVKTSGDTVGNISELIIQLIKNNSKGIYNVGTSSKHLYDLAPNAKIISPPSHVPKDTRMDLTKLKNDLKRIN